MKRVAHEVALETVLCTMSGYTIIEVRDNLEPVFWSTHCTMFIGRAMDFTCDTKYTKALRATVRSLAIKNDKAIFDICIACEKY